MPLTNSPWPNRRKNHVTASNYTCSLSCHVLPAQYTNISETIRELELKVSIVVVVCVVLLKDISSMQLPVETAGPQVIALVVGAGEKQQFHVALDILGCATRLVFLGRRRDQSGAGGGRAGTGKRTARPDSANLGARAAVVGCGRGSRHGRERRRLRDVGKRLACCWGGTSCTTLSIANGAL